MAGCRASRSSTCRASRSRPTRGHLVHRSGDGRVSRARSRWTAAPTAWRCVLGIDDAKLYVTSGPADDPALRGRGDRRRRGQERPGHGRWPPSAARARARGWPTTTPPSRSTSWAGPTLRRGRQPGRRSVDGLRHRAARATRSTPTPRCPTARAGAWALDVESQYPTDDRQQLLVFGADGRTASIDDGLARLRLAAAGRDRRRADGRRASTCSPGSCSGAGSSPALVGRVRAPRGDALRPVADRHERRLRRPVHRRRLHAVRRGLDGLVALARRVLGRDAGHRRSCWASRSRRSGSRPTRSARSCCCCSCAARSAGSWRSSA